MLYDITKEELDELKRYAENEDAVLADYGILKRFLNLQFAVMNKMAKDLPRQRSAAVRNQERIERMKAKMDSSHAAGEFPDTGLDSVEIAQALLRHLQQKNTYRLSLNKVMYILYEMYASWLSSKGERLFIEHPVAQESGPWFWRVRNKVDIRTKVSDSVISELKAKNPGVAVFVANAAEKYYDYSLTDLEKHVKSMPYRNADSSHNKGKWNGEIKDADIYAWKKS